VRLFLLFAVALLLVVVLLGRWFVQADAAQVARVLRGVAWTAGAALLLLLMFFGRPGLAILLASGLLPLLMRSYQRRQGGMPGAGKPPPAGHSSAVQTRFLRMTLDHDTGAMSGEVLEGRFRGRQLDELEPEALLQLLAECREDPQSAAVLEAYLDRTYGPEWRDQARRAEQSAPPETGRMSRDEAYEILGLQPGATPDEIRAAHRQLMQKFHPDRGGSTYLAAKINQAKDLLLAE
jgi:hypothetical protein